MKLSKNNFSAKWFQGIKDAEEKQKKIQKLYSSRDLFEELDELIKQKIVTNSISRMPDYDNPNWAYLQAHKNGYIQALEEIRTYLQFPDKDK